MKRFARQGEAIILKPEHPTMAPIVVKPGQQNVKILGKVIALLRERL